MTWGGCRRRRLTRRKERRVTIPIKMKMADPAEVTALMTKAVQDCIWVDDATREHADQVVSDITLALSRAACVMIQPDLT